MSVKRQQMRHPERRLHDVNRNVIIGYCRNDSVDGLWSDCLADLLVHDGHTNQRVMDVMRVVGGPMIAKMRNKLAAAFLDHVDPETGQRPTHLLMLDADMTFEPDVLDRMYERAMVLDAPLLGGLCFAGGRGGPAVPTLFTARQERHEDGTSHISLDLHRGYPKEDRVIEIDATGAACLLIRRDVLVKLHERWAPLTTQPWFAVVEQKACAHCGTEADDWGEDVTFCIRARQAGFSLLIDLACKFGHRKTYVLDETEYVRQYELEKAQGAVALAEHTRKQSFGGESGKAIA